MHEMKIETFAKIHKFLCDQPDIKEWERISIMSYIASEHLEGDKNKKI